MSAANQSAVDFLISVAIAIYGSDTWNTPIDWMEVVFADLDFISDILFALEVLGFFQACKPAMHVVKDKNYGHTVSFQGSCPPIQKYFTERNSSNVTNCTCVSWVSQEMVSELKIMDYLDKNECFPRFPDAKDYHGLEGLMMCSFIFVGLPVVINLCIMLRQFHGDSSSGLEENVESLHKLIAPYFLNPFFFLFYLLLHGINLVLIASSAERMAKIIAGNPRQNPAKIAKYNTFGFLFETVPQIICQSIFLTICGPNIIAIISLSVSAWRTISSYSLKVFYWKFPHLAVANDSA
jgi:hypothetical protein